MQRDVAVDPVVTDFTILIDTREQAPYRFTEIYTDKSDRCGIRPIVVQTRGVGLQTGDYSLDGFEDKVAVERKSLQDLYGTLGQGRGRFERELERLSKMDVAMVVVESTLQGILYRPCPQCSGQRNICNEIGQWMPCAICNGRGVVHPVEHSKLSPKSVFRSMIAWTVEYPTIHWMFGGERVICERLVFRFLKRWYEKKGAHVK